MTPATTSAVPDWLAALCVDCGAPESITRRPFTFERSSGEPWTAGTNNWLLVAIPGAGAEPAANQGLVSQLRDWIERPGGTIVDGHQFRDWVGEGPPPASPPLAPLPEVPCVSCGGTGETREHEDCEDCSHTESCDDCDGTGKRDDVFVAAPSYRPGRLGAVVVDRILLARLSHLLIGPVRVRIEAEDKPVALHGNGWAALIMPMRWDAPVEAFALP